MSIAYDGVVSSFALYIIYVVSPASIIIAPVFLLNSPADIVKKDSVILLIVIRQIVVQIWIVFGIMAIVLESWLWRRSMEVTVRLAPERNNHNANDGHDKDAHGGPPAGAVV